jgi:hypothetical protein
VAKDVDALRDVRLSGCVDHPVLHLAGIGVASHNQWDELLIQLSAIANKLELPINQRVDEIRSMLAT